MRPHKGSGALLIRELIGMPRMPTTMEPGVGLPPLAGGGGLQGGSCKYRCNPGIGGAYISRAGGVAPRYRGLSPRCSSLSLARSPCETNVAS